MQFRKINSRVPVFALEMQWQNGLSSSWKEFRIPEVSLPENQLLICPSASLTASLSRSSSLSYGLAHASAPPRWLPRSHSCRTLWRPPCAPVPRLAHHQAWELHEVDHTVAVRVDHVHHVRQHNSVTVLIAVVVESYKLWRLLFSSFPV